MSARMVSPFTHRRSLWTEYGFIPVRAQGHVFVCVRKSMHAGCAGKSMVSHAFKPVVLPEGQQSDKHTGGDPPASIRRSGERQIHQRCLQEARQSGRTICAECLHRAGATQCRGLGVTSGYGMIETEKASSGAKCCCGRGLGPVTQHVLPAGRGARDAFHRLSVCLEPELCSLWGRTERDGCAHRGHSHRTWSHAGWRPRSRVACSCLNSTQISKIVHAHHTKSSHDH
jgi:hypothetical protein